MMFGPKREFRCGRRPSLRPNRNPATDSERLSLRPAAREVPGYLGATGWIEDGQGFPILGRANDNPAPCAATSSKGGERARDGHPTGVACAKSLGRDG